MNSVNQVNQLYVVNSLVTGNNDVTNASAAGAIKMMTDPTGNYIYFKYRSNGGVIATDRIKKCKVKWISVTSATAMRKPLRGWAITLNSTVNSGNPIVGQDYIINFSFKNYFGMSDEDTYEKHASARAFTTTPSDLYRDLAISLAKNMSREIDKPFSVSLATSGNPVEVTPTTKKESLNGAYTGIRLLELEQPWELGRLKQTSPDFNIHFVPIFDNGLERYDWGTFTVANSGDYIRNGKDTADLEWFCKGERADQYRGKDWPLSISTPATLMVDPAKEYDYLIVHFWDDIDNEGPQKSERDLTLVTRTQEVVGDTVINLDDLANTIAGAVGLDGYISGGSFTPYESE